MQVVQLALSQATYANALRDALAQDWAFRDFEVLRVDAPDLQKQGVIVMDSEALEGLQYPLQNPERVVLIACRDPQQLSRAWNAGIVSVVYDNDPLSTAMLAIMAARFRVSNPRP
ncbi:MAG: hypothetical protein HY236_06185 [Acidobacteria bacterium]|nr:hypothetical protein [Acidobacteriota bacterium]